MTKVEKQRLSEKRFIQHMREHMRHPNSIYLRERLCRMFTGVALFPEYLKKSYKEIFDYLMLDTSRLDPCLLNLHFKVMERKDTGEVLDTWLELDGERLSIQEIENLWQLIRD